MAQDYDAMAIRLRAARESENEFLPVSEFVARLKNIDDRIRYHNPDASSPVILKIAAGLARQLEEFLNFDFYVPSRYEPAWTSLLQFLQKRGVASFLRLAAPFADEPALYYFDLKGIFNFTETDGGRTPHTRFSRGVSEDYHEAISKASVGSPSTVGFREIENT